MVGEKKMKSKMIKHEFATKYFDMSLFRVGSSEYQYKHNETNEVLNLNILDDYLTYEGSFEQYQRDTHKRKRHETK